MDEITLTEAVGPEKSKTSLLCFLAEKFIAHTNIQIYVRAQFSSEFDFFFEMLVTMSSIRINNN